MITECIAGHHWVAYAGVTQMNKTATAYANAHLKIKTWRCVGQTLSGCVACAPAPAVFSPLQACCYRDAPLSSCGAACSSVLRACSP